MRYVVAVMTVTIFILWDGLQNDGRYLAKGVREANLTFQYLGF